MSASIKSAIKGFCNISRVNEAIVRMHRADFLILTYHGVLSNTRPDRWSYENWVDADSFRSQLRWLKRHFATSNLAGLRRWYDGKWTEQKPPVMVTFDDGYRNNLTIAAPILKEEGVPALFFLATGYVGTSRVIWNDEVRMRVLHWPENEITLPTGAQISVPSELRARRAIAIQVNGACKQLTEQDLTKYLEFLRGKTASVEVMDDTEARAFLTWDEARKLAEMGFEIGSHTVEHPILSQISRGRIAAELRESKATIERELGQPCQATAYPNGTVRDVNAIVLEEVRTAGYEWAFMTTPVWLNARADPYQVPRISTPGHTDLSTFKFYASGLHTRFSGAA